MSAGQNPIVPYEEVTRNLIVSFNVTCRNVNLFENASFTVDSFSDKEKLISRQVLTMTNAQYLEWNNNDDYVIIWVADTLGYTLLTPPTSASNIIVSEP
jgi:hypothetical protein